MEPVDRESLRCLVLEHELAEVTDEIVSSARMGIVLRDDGPAGKEPGTSRLGGLPDLPPGVAWPQWRGRPHSFVGQIRLENVAPFDEQQILPPSGLLSFFWDSAAVGQYAAGCEAEDGAGWGFDPEDVGAARVLYVPEPSAASRRDRPESLPRDCILGARAVAPQRRITLPPWESTDFGFLALSDRQTDSYLRLLEALNRIQAAGDAGVPVHQLLGHPDQIQGDMQLEVQLVTHGLYCGNSTGYEDPRRVELEPGSPQWRLLLQVDSDEERLGVTWGDGGRIYLWSREPDLAARRFDASWLLLQCS